MFYLYHIYHNVCVKCGYWLVPLLPIMSRQVMDSSFHDITWRVVSEIHHILDIRLPYSGTRVKDRPSRSYQPNLVGQLVWPYCTSLQTNLDLKKLVDVLQTTFSSTYRARNENCSWVQNWPNCASGGRFGDTSALVQVKVCRWRFNVQTSYFTITSK